MYKYFKTIIMKVCLTLLLTAVFMIKVSSQSNSKLAIALETWVKNPNTKLSENLKKVGDDDVKNANETRLICEALSIVKKKIAGSFNEAIENDLYELVVLFQQVTTKEAAEQLDEKGIPLLADILKIIHDKNYHLESFASTELMILKMFSIYSNEIGLQMLADLLSRDFKKDEFLWSIILQNVAEEEKKYNLVIKKLAGRIPGDFLGICYLDMCNSINIKLPSFVNPFNSRAGYLYLDSLIRNATSEEQSYVVSATTAIPFIDPSYQEDLLGKIIKYDDIDVRIEASWAGAKLGKKEYVDKLINFAKDYRYSNKAVRYLEELGLDSLIPSEAKDPDFSALSEMCEWLAHPNEFGAYPDKAEIYDKRELFWPPTKDKRVLYIIKYVYKNYNDDNTDETGVGMVGSITFSLFEVDNIDKLKPAEIYAIYCNWELEKKNYEDIKSGLNLLRKYNKDFK